MNGPQAGNSAANSPYQVAPRALVRASALAAAGAGLILVLFVLPAEWGVDPTGVGAALGLTRLADADGGQDDLPAGDTPAAEAAPALDVPPQTRESVEARTAMRSDRMTLVVAPHTGTEIKSRMNVGDHFVFRWTSTAPVRMDMHGEPLNAQSDEFTSYWKQRDLAAAQGQFTAPFEGTHGWYWRNGGEEPATITLEATGFYGELYERPVE